MTWRMTWNSSATPLPPCISREARAISRALAQELRLTQGDHFWRGRALVEEAADAQGALETEGDIGHHVGELELDELVGGQRTPELVAVEGILAGGVPAEFSRAQGAPGDAVAGAVEAAEGAAASRFGAPGSRFSAGTKTSSMTISPVELARRLNLPFNRRGWTRPSHAALEDEAADGAIAFIAAAVGFSPDDEDIGDRGIGDPHLAAMQDRQPSVDFWGARYPWRLGRCRDSARSSRSSRPIGRLTSLGR